jgi:RNA polymerase sigma-70 factor (ECF subfamily)
MKRDEKDIIKHIIRGETHLYAHFVEKYSEAVFSLVVHMVNCREDAEEITQDIFLKAYEKLSSFNVDSSFSTWLYRIAYNTTISALRKRPCNSIAIAEEILADTDDTLIDETLSGESEELLQRLEKAISMLDAEERALVTLYHLEERSIDETAQITGLKESNVKVKLHRTRKKLYLLIKEQEI